MRVSSYRLLPVVAACVAALALAGCGSSSGGSAAGTSSATSAAATSAAETENPDPPATGKITVFAAASLTEAFTAIGKQFEAANPGATVTFSFGAGSTLAEQLQQGAPADVYATASQKNIDPLVASQVVAPPLDFASNSMEIAVPKGNPAGITGIADLAKPGVKVAICQAQVACGTLAEKVFANAKVTVKPATMEVDVKSVLSKVKLGEVDAGMVYVTDVLAAQGKVDGVEIPADVNGSTRYPIAIVSRTNNLTAAKAFLDYVLSPAGQTVLAADGFAKP